MAHPRHIMCDTPQRLIIVYAVLAVLCTVYASAAATAHYSSTPAYSASLFADSLRINDTGADDVHRKLEEPAAMTLSLDDNRVDLCDTLCECGGRLFERVECDLDLNKEYFFGTENYIPRDATLLNVRLAPKARLIFQTDFLKDTTVERINIEGSTTRTNDIYVKFSSNSITKGKAANLSITIRNCNVSVLHENAIGGDVNVELNIENGKLVEISSNAINSKTFSTKIISVKDLRIYEKAFDRSTVNLHIYNSYIESLYRFDAFFREIFFYNCTIGAITNKTFEVLEINAIIFSNCRIKIINTKAITEKLQTRVMNITGGSIGMIEAEAISRTGITKLVLADNQIDTIESNAIHVSAIDVWIVGNRILRVNHEWLHVSEWKKVIVSNNTFGEYNLMVLGKRNEKSIKCTFEKEELQAYRKNYLYYIIAAGVLLMIVIIVQLIIIASCARKRKSVMNRDCDGNTIQSLTNYGRLSKKDRRIIKETMKVYKRKYSGESYKELNKHVQNMLRESIDETELVQIIEEILPILNRCENSGDTFLAFSEILERLLQAAIGDYVIMMKLPFIPNR